MVTVMTWLLPFDELVEILDLSGPMTRKFLHAHGLRAAQRVTVGTTGTRALYDGDQVQEHATKRSPTCPACVRARRGVSSFAGGPTVSARQGRSS
jgi:hypothetical protein